MPVKGKHQPVSNLDPQKQNQPDAYSKLFLDMAMDNGGGGVGSSNYVCTDLYHGFAGLQVHMWPSQFGGFPVNHQKHGGSGSLLVGRAGRAGLAVPCARAAPERRGASAGP